MAPVLAQNQKSGISQLCTIGRANTAASTRKITPNPVSVYLSSFRAGCAPWYSAVRPAMMKIALGTNREPYSAGQGASQPPRKSSVAIELTVTIFRYSAMKNAANFMLLYST